MTRPTRRGRITAVALAAALTVLFAVPAGASTYDVAIHDVYGGTVTPDPTCGGFHVEGHGASTGSPTGPGTYAGLECATVLANAGTVVIRGAFVVTAANGDRLEGTYVGTSGLPDANGITHPAGVFRVTGGTGRFAGASGGGRITALVNVYTIQTVNDLVGVVSLR